MKRGGPQIGVGACTRLDLPHIEAGHDDPHDGACEHERMRPTVLIVDDHADFRASARALLEAEGFDVVGEAASGEEAIAEAGRLRPEVILLDIQLPGDDGFAVARRLAAESSGA